MTPPCKCHDEPMFWEPDGRKKAGGYWRCIVKRRASLRAHYHRDPVRHQAGVDRYRATPAGRRARMRSRLNADTRRIQAAINQLEE